MTTNSDFNGFENVKLVTGANSSSVIFSVGGPADIGLEPVFGEFCVEGSGYDWQSAVAGHFTDAEPAMLKRFRFDPEAGMFCAYGDDLAALHAVATVVEAMLADADTLRHAMRVAVEHDLLD
ncbi:immunity protein 51 of polymorphic toxin system [Stackebrandtia endophytica]|uniref:Immunity protein 51 of polymorphic toxin system n=1 Tax=Stackebrandtia endophytica TaxID=1496996 RepID=A0A543B4D5_9ACTN|nr:Imm51 family immunity protein [Stackebrandtia endophytica]TQL79684.1 immunity protein 51 of polymorphic toxin system [Stackebrandtia endophytica]